MMITYACILLKIFRNYSMQCFTIFIWPVSLSNYNNACKPFIETSRKFQNQNCMALPVFDLAHLMIVYYPDGSYKVYLNLHRLFTPLSISKRSVFMLYDKC